MSDTPSDLKYTPMHVWVDLQEDNSVKIGITDHAQEELGDIVFVELPEMEKNFSSGDECAVVESVKSASDIYCPLKGEIIEVNTELDDSPELINADPYGDGWIFILNPDDISELDELMDADAYLDFLEE